jgi:hypothetical protein
MTVFVSVNTSKQAGGPDQLRAVANLDAAEPGAWPLRCRVQPGAPSRGDTLGWARAAKVLQSSPAAIPCL